MIEQPSVFDYNSLDIDTRTFVLRVINDTHLLIKQTDENIIQIGKNLQALKDKLSHGEFLPLLEVEFGWTERTAQNFMNYARLVEKNERLSFLPREVGYVLGQKSMPDKVLELVETGQISPTVSAIREARREIQEGQQQNLAPQEFIDEVFPGLQWQKDNRDLGLDEFSDLLPAESRETEEETSEPITSIHPLERPLYEAFVQATTPVPIIPESWKLPQELRGNTLELPTKSPTLTALQSSESNEWYTPAQYVEAARELMGCIDLDPASCELANKVIQANTYYDADTNGLDKPWHGRIWLNPPYGRDTAGSNQEVWSHYLMEQYTAGITKEAVLLVNANTEARWFQPFYNYLICFTNHRIKFYNAEGTPNQPTQGNALVYFGSQRERFYELFHRFGVVVQRFAA